MRVVKEEMDGTYGLMRWKSRGILSVRLSLRDSQEDWKRRLKIEALIYRKWTRDGLPRDRHRHQQECSGFADRFMTAAQHF